MRFSPRLDAPTGESKTVLTADGVSKWLGGREILRNVACSLRFGARVALVGPNGAGKTTLLRVLLGDETADVGTVRRTPGARFGYLTQESASVDPQLTVFDVYREGLEGPESTLVAALLGNGLFRLEDISKRVGQLSAGQRRKLDIARLVALRPTALVLDEPTNYISLDVLEALEAASLAFPGPVLVVTHDRWFLRRFGGEVWSLTDGMLKVYSAGSY
jgi:macrolide transport system ATP-binding/permease protein